MVQQVSLPRGTDWIDRVGEKASDNMKRYESCTQSILAVFMEELGIREPQVMRAAGAMHGGMLSSLTCGIHTAGLMVLGLLIGRERLEDGMDGLLPAVMPAQELVKRLNQRIGSHSCLELTGVDFTDLNKAMDFILSEDHNQCVKRVGDGAEEIARFLIKLEGQGALFRPGTGGGAEDGG
jgi:C_GCAxxG_C_C family probable redox protein